MLESMIKNEKWTMRPWKETLKDALSGWTMYIPGVSSSVLLILLPICASLPAD